MFQFITSDKLDARKWDKMLKNLHANGIYSYSWYQNAVAEKWMIAMDEKGKNFMLFPFKSKAGIKMIYQPFFTREIACFLDDKTTPGKIINQLPDSYRQIQFALRDIRGLDASFKIEKWMHQKLDLKKEYEVTAKKYAENAKRILKKTGKKSWKLEETENVKIVVDLFKKSKGNEIKDLKEADYRRLQHLMKAGIVNGYGKCYQVVSENDEILAAGYFFKENGRLTYLKGSATENGKKEGAMYFLFDKLIQNYSEKLDELDFGGSRIHSVAAFYKKFGAADSDYYFVTKQNFPLYIKLLRKARKLIKK